MFGQDHSQTLDTIIRKEGDGAGGRAGRHGLSYAFALDLGKFLITHYGNSLQDHHSRIHYFHSFVTRLETESEQAKIRNWCKLMPNNAKMSNCYRSRKTDEDLNMRVPQSFSFFPREGVAASMLWYLWYVLVWNSTLIPRWDSVMFFPVATPSTLQTPLRPASNASWWSWNRNWRTRSKTPPWPRRSARHLRVGEREHVWHGFDTATIVSVAGIIDWIRREFLEPCKYNPGNCAAVPWPNQGWWTAGTCGANWCWFSGHG